jgi:hypothetical protein
MNVDVIQVVSLLGAFLVLAGYGGQQYGGLRGDGLSYGLLNLVGSAMLAGSAIVPLNGGVLLLESAWALISLGIVYKALTRGRNRASSDSETSSKPTH